ncbi:GNAT family N-acetyltransferase [Streptomyces sp. NPDC058657]|uniref:GNAT family N-acetyltransferase n=1 Tax=unclassified Streptomyces TaxID=2593676 RepID=UPI00365D190D
MDQSPDPPPALPPQPPTGDLSVKPTLAGARALLRPFTEDDLPAMLAALRDPEVLRLTGSPADDFDEAATRAWYLSRAAQSDRIDLAVVDLATGTCAGEVVLNEWDPANRSINFRTLLGPGGRNRGLGSEACRLIVGYAFEVLATHRVSLGVYDFNPRARRAYEKAGFVAEGTEREALWADGRWVDSTYMSILAHEWAAHRGHPEP